MKKIILITAASMLTAAAFSFEAKGTVSNETQFDFYENDFSEPDLIQKDSISGSLRLPLTDSGKTYISAEGLFSFEYDRTFSDPATDSTELTADLTLCKFSSIIPAGSTNITVSAGRFSMSDATAIVYNQNEDGLLFQCSSPYVSVSAYGAYTGLLNAKTVTMLTPVASTFGTEDKDFYEFAPAYAAGALSINLPYLLFNQSITAECFAFMDTEGPGKISSEDDKRVYASFILDGPLSSSLFYNAGTTFLFSEERDFSPANLSKLSVLFFPTENIMLNLNGYYASGSQGSLKPFASFTSATAGLNATEKKYTELIKGGLSCTARLTPEAILAAGADILFDYPENEVKYSGTQLSGKFTYQAFSDLEVSFEAQTFIADRKEENKTTVKLTVTLAF